MDDRKPVGGCQILLNAKAVVLLANKNSPYSCLVSGLS